MQPYHRESRLSEFDFALHPNIDNIRPRLVLDHVAVVQVSTGNKAYMPGVQATRSLIRGPGPCKPTHRAFHQATGRAATCLVVYHTEREALLSGTKQGFWHNKST